MPSSCGFSITSRIPLQVPPLLEQATGWTADALVRAERVGDPVLLFWATQWRAEAAARAGDIDEMDRCIDIRGSLVAQLDQPTLNWIDTYDACQASTDRRRYRSSRDNWLRRRSRSAPTAASPTPPPSSAHSS